MTLPITFNEKSFLLKGLTLVEKPQALPVWEVEVDDETDFSHTLEGALRGAVRKAERAQAVRPQE